MTTQEESKPNIALPEDVTRRAAALQEWLAERATLLAGRSGRPRLGSKMLFDGLRKRLLAYASPAHSPRILSSSLNDVFSLMKMLPPETALAEQTHRKLREVPAVGARSVILGGGVPKSTNFDREPAVPHFKREDGAWFEFRFIVEDRGDAQVDVLAYGCEIRFPGTEPSWIRFDLNLPGHENEESGLRSHVHPGTESWSLPAPKFAPDEILDLLVWHTRPDREPRSGA
jgi:hypothetical protein